MFSSFFTFGIEISSFPILNPLSITTSLSRLSLKSTSPFKWMNIFSICPDLNCRGIESVLDKASAMVLIFFKEAEVDSKSIFMGVFLASMVLRVPLKLNPSISRWDRSPFTLIWFGVE